MEKTLSLREVASSNIKRIGWEDGDLYVLYLSGTLYKYKGVPKDVYTSLCRTDSFGQFLNKHVKGHYEYEKLGAIK